MRGSEQKTMQKTRSQKKSMRADMRIPLSLFTYTTMTKWHLDLQFNNKIISRRFTLCLEVLNPFRLNFWIWFRLKRVNERMSGSQQVCSNLSLQVEFLSELKTWSWLSLLSTELWCTSCLPHNKLITWYGPLGGPGSEGTQMFIMNMCTLRWS